MLEWNCSTSRAEGMSDDYHAVTVLKSHRRWNYPETDAIVLDRGTTLVPTQFGPAKDGAGRNCFFSVFVPFHKDEMRFSSEQSERCHQ